MDARNRPAVASETPPLYGEYAEWFHLLTRPDDYQEEAAVYARLMEESIQGPLRTILELGSGGGNNASHLKHRFELPLTDRSPAMLKLSQALNPECGRSAGSFRGGSTARAFQSCLTIDWPGLPPARAEPGFIL